MARRCLAADRKRLEQDHGHRPRRDLLRQALDEVHTDYATTVADVENHQIIDILPTRKYTDVAGWIDKQPRAWKERIRFGALDMSATYAAVYTVMLPKADQVVDPFHVISLANRCLDAVRRRVQTEQTGHRGRRTTRSIGPGASCSSAKRSSTRRRPSVCGHCSSWAIRVPRSPSPIGSKSAYATSIERAIPTRPARCSKSSRPLPPSPMPPEVQRLGRTIQAWFDKIANFHLARVSNGPTEALNNLIKRIKRIGFGFRNFENYRIRALLYAGKPNWRVLGSIVVR